MAECDVCRCEGQPIVATRRLHSAEREEKIKDAVWSTSRVTLHFVDFREHDVAVCAACRRAARAFYLRPFIPVAVTLVAYLAWLALQPIVAPNVSPVWTVVPALVPLLLLITAPGRVRRRYGLGERQFGEQPLRMFSLDSYLIMCLTRQHPERVYWTPKWFQYFERRFQ